MPFILYHCHWLLCLKFQEMPVSPSTWSATKWTGASNKWRSSTLAALRSVCGPSTWTLGTGWPSGVSGMPTSRSSQSLMNLPRCFVTFLSGTIRRISKSGWDWWEKGGLFTSMSFKWTHFTFGLTRFLSVSISILPHPVQVHALDLWNKFGS